MSSQYQTLKEMELTCSAVLVKVQRLRNHLLCTAYACRLT